MASPRAELEKQIRAFAGELQTCLNRTVTHGIHLSTVLREDGHVGWVGYRITHDAVGGSEPIPLTVSRANPVLYLRLLHTLVLDNEGRYLMVMKSTYEVSTGEAGEHTLFHYDYVRGAERWPEAHVQVYGENELLGDVFSACGRSTHASLPRLHFPVGPRRYRPTLEDVVGFLIKEGLVESRDGWSRAVDAGNKAFQRRQLRAAVRRDPQPAVDLLRELGYAVDERTPEP